MKIQKSVQMKEQVNGIIQKCVQARKKNKYTILKLSEVLEIDRRLLSSFEKGNFSIFLADNILAYFGYKLLIWDFLRDS